ncbi:MAG: FAD-binding protein [Litorilinea sp.]
MAVNETNWAGNHAFAAAQIAYPATVAEVQELVMRNRKVKAVGARHSFNDIADSEETLISLAHFPETLAFDTQAHTVTVPAGMTYGRLCALLQEMDYAIHNMASLPHISVGGAVATATHGSGDANGNLATAVAGLALVTADGACVQLARGQQEPAFAGAVVGLGALGVVTHLTLDIRPTYNVQQAVYERLPLTQLFDHFDAIMGAAYSVSLFTDWQADWVNQLWLKRLVPEEGEIHSFAPEFHGAILAQTAMHPSGRSSPESCTSQLGEAGPWHERLPHFRVDHAPSMGNELQSEYFVARRHAVAALRTLADLRAELASVVLVSEVRTVAADDLWLSPAYEQDCVGFHFTLRNDWEAVRPVLPVIEAALAPFAPRPHWGKLFTMASEQVQARYPRLADFRALVAQLDPGGKFHNAYLAQIL